VTKQLASTQNYWLAAAFARKLHQYPHFSKAAFKGLWYILLERFVGREKVDCLKN
jgi:hypothetical protein